MKQVIGKWIKRAEPAPDRTHHLNGMGRGHLFGCCTIPIGHRFGRCEACDEKTAESKAYKHGA